MIKTFEDLDIYKESYKLALEIYKITRNYPRDEIYSLTSNTETDIHSSFDNYIVLTFIENNSCKKTKILI